MSAALVRAVAKRLSPQYREILDADYWKPIQAGTEPSTDSLQVKTWSAIPLPVIHSETYIFSLPASPHIAARNENQRVEPTRILSDCQRWIQNRPLVIEGAGGLMVPLNENEFVIDLVKALDA